MDVFVNPEWEWPIHDQLFRQLKAAIEDGCWQDGERLPSVRELAAVLRIHRNTVVKVYAALEELGYVSSHSGKGFFVHPPRKKPLSNEMEQLIKETLERIRDLGEDPVLFAQALLPRAMREHAKEKPRVRLAVIECTVEQTTLLARDLARALDADVEPIVLDALGRWNKADLNQFALFVTTFQHVEEVQQALPGRSDAVIPGLLSAHLETIKALQNLSPGDKIGIACVNWEGTHRLRDMIHQAGFEEINLVEASLDDPQTLPRLLEDVPLIVAATKVAEILKAFKPDAPVIVDDRTFTEGTLREIRSRLEKNS
ncbi:GntR family transcriptional regulator [Sulfobacillus thermosulfidooxidans]|uniref:GntR family transcriptional regulator n=1 Tax=Sulfobacillus thermosulfidooxidans TaxID=28034 RepID=UPI0006B564D6|nr:GntR family transcriptional regulator [Sulfobacillus thermosulfidooxidans]